MSDPLWTNDEIEAQLNSVTEKRIPYTDARAIVDQIASDYEAVRLADNTQIVNLTADKAQLTVQAAALTDQNSALQATVAALNDSINTFNTQVASLDMQIDTLNTQVATLTTRAIDDETQISQLQVTIADLTPDVIIIPSQTQLSVSQFQTALTHVDGNDLLWLPTAAKSAGIANLGRMLHWQQKHVMGWGSADPWQWDGTGTRPPKPTNWGTLDSFLQMGRDAGTPLAINTQMVSWHLKGEWNAADGTTRVYTYADAWRDSGIFLKSEEANFLIYIEELANRYLGDPWNVRIWTTGTEYHGLFLGRTATGNHPTWNSYRYDAYAGTPGPNADAGAAYVHNITVNKILEVAAAKGIDPLSLTIQSNYPPLVVMGVADSNCVAVGHPLRDKPWGSMDKRPLEAIQKGIPLLNRVDVIGYDFGTLNKDDKYSQGLTDLVNLQRYDDVCSYVQSLFPTKRFVCMETYDKPYRNPGANSAPYRAMLRADSFRRMLKAGLTSAVIWGTAGEAMGAVGDPPKIAEAAVLDPSGNLTLMGRVVQLFHDHFGPGTPIFDATVTGTGVNHLISVDGTLLINTTNTVCKTQFERAVYDLQPYELRYVLR